MARRSPAQVRENLPTSHLERSISRIAGLTPAGEAAIVKLERTRLRPGAAREALDAWVRYLRDPYHRLFDPQYGCGVLECCPDCCGVGATACSTSISPLSCCGAAGRSCSASVPNGARPTGRDVLREIAEHAGVCAPVGDPAARPADRGVGSRGCAMWCPAGTWPKNPNRQGEADRGGGGVAQAARGVDV